MTDPRAVVGGDAVLLTNATVFSDPQSTNRIQWDGPAPRPLAWNHEGGLLDQKSTLGASMDYQVGGPTYSGGSGRSWYTSLGHAADTWKRAEFQGHVLGGISWVLQKSQTLKSA
ncbi:hypothetical protein CBS101457_005711 [Exobasidium rhododendri]|nr:hypothetical protein CBS101457_005711 [Exobasidium rhododendri]